MDQSAKRVWGFEESHLIWRFSIASVRPRDKVRKKAFAPKINF